MTLSRVVLVLAFAVGLVLSKLVSPPVGIAAGFALLLVWLYLRYAQRRRALLVLQKARHAMDADAMRGALRKLEALSGRDPRTHAFVTLHRGVAFLIEEDFEAARAHFDAVAVERLSPDENRTARANRLFCRAMAGEDVVRDAEVLVEEATLAGEAATAGPLAVLGSCLLAAGRAKDAVPVMERADALSKDHPPAWRAMRAFFLGEALRESGRRVAAYESYLRAEAIGSPRFKAKARERIVSLTRDGQPPRD